MLKCGQALLDMFYPVGAGYITKSSLDNPNERFNGSGCSSTWVRASKGKAIVGVDENDSDFNSAGKTLGEKTHKLTEEEIATHSHIIGVSLKAAAGNNMYRPENIGGVDMNGAVQPAGGDKPHNNIQPSECWYIWERTA